MVARLKAPITCAEFAARLRKLGMSQHTFAMRWGFSLELINTNCRFAVPSSTAYRSLLVEEMLAQGQSLIKPPKERVPRLAMQRIFDALNAALTGDQARRNPAKRRKRKPRRVNYLTPKYLGTIPPAPAVDELEQPATWQQLASRIGADEAQRLHAKLAQRRPRGPGRPADDADRLPLAKVTDPI